MKILFPFLIILFLIPIQVLAQVKTPTESNNSKKDTNTPIKLDTTSIEKVYFTKSKIIFNETVHDFGKVIQNHPAICVFEFTNTISEDIAIAEVQRSCSCTTPDWNQYPVSTNKTGKISVTYNSANLGDFSKTISVKFSNGDVVYLTLMGTVASH